MSLSFPFPPLAHSQILPIWTEQGFKVGNELAPILKYSANNAGWIDDLTLLHETTAGESHFIDQASRDHAISQIKIYCKQKNPVILEIGCSSGFMLQELKNNFPQATLLGADVVDEPLTKLSKILPNIPLLQFDLTSCPLLDNCVDVVVMLNVLEHIKNDATAIQQVHRILKPNGILILEVPAGQHLFDVYDKLLMHYKRYNSHELNNLIQHAGFEINRASYLGFFLYPGFAMIKKRNKKLLERSNEVQKEWVKNQISSTKNNLFFHWLMRMELWIGKYISYPLGIRHVITARVTR